MLFTVSAVADAQTLPRLLEHFALRLQLPSRVVAERTGDMMAITIEHPSLDAATAMLIAEKMRSMVLVTQVSLQDAADKSKERFEHVSA